MAMQRIKPINAVRGTPTRDQLQLLKLLRKKELEYIRNYLRSIGRA
jgi:hypothetical protein